MSALVLNNAVSYQVCASYSAVGQNLNLAVPEEVVISNHS
jgi:hypothetical protein